MDCKKINHTRVKQKTNVQNIIFLKYEPHIRDDKCERESRDLRQKCCEGGLKGSIGRKSQYQNYNFFKVWTPYRRQEMKKGKYRFKTEVLWRRPKAALAEKVVGRGGKQQVLIWPPWKYFSWKQKYFSWKQKYFSR